MRLLTYRIPVWLVVVWIALVMPAARYIDTMTGGNMQGAGIATAHWIQGR